ncbi:hypothetical protein [Acinetobacter sp. HY1485]|uniref:hypothetical protein n=1 Tax=Acinetobacter sp. HY1485 TaxID=2970918 RepID=UPI0022B948D1|nr:hypothetical protein [Acinetobacter sp. HY1485]
MENFSLKIRVSFSDVHYGSNIVSNSFITKMFGDAITGFMGIYDGNESLLQSWDEVSFLAPVLPGDFLEINVYLYKESQLKRYFEVEAKRFLKLENLSNSNLLSCDQVVARGKAIAVIPFEVYKKRKNK